MNKPADERGTPIELRKQLLITQGAMYRSGIKSSREKVVTGLNADTLARNALKQVGLVALSAWRNRVGLATSMPAFMPLVIGGVSKLWQQPKLKPVVRGVAIAGAVATAAVLLTKWTLKKRTAKGNTKDSDASAVPDNTTSPNIPSTSEVLGAIAIDTLGSALAGDVSAP